MTFMKTERNNQGSDSEKKDERYLRLLSPKNKETDPS